MKLKYNLDSLPIILQIVILLPTAFFLVAVGIVAVVVKVVFLAFYLIIELLFPPSWCQDERGVYYDWFDTLHTIATQGWSDPL